MTKIEHTNEYNIIKEKSNSGQFYKMLSAEDSKTGVKHRICDSEFTRYYTICNGIALIVKLRDQTIKIYTPPKNGWKEKDIKIKEIKDLNEKTCELKVITVLGEELIINLKNLNPEKLIFKIAEKVRK